MCIFINVFTHFHYPFIPCNIVAGTDVPPVIQNRETLLQKAVKIVLIDCGNRCGVNSQTKGVDDRYLFVCLLYWKKNKEQHYKLNNWQEIKNITVSKITWNILNITILVNYVMCFREHHNIFIIAFFAAYTQTRTTYLFFFPPTCFTELHQLSNFFVHFTLLGNVSRAGCDKTVAGANWQR